MQVGASFLVPENPISTCSKSTLAVPRPSHHKKLDGGKAAWNKFNVASFYGFMGRFEPQDPI